MLTTRKGKGTQFGRGKVIPEIPTDHHQVRQTVSSSSPVKNLLMEERRKNSRLKLEVERLRSCVDILKRNLKATREELEQKKHLITKMMERGLTSHSPSSSVEVEPGKTSSEEESTEGCVDDLDIDSLLQANLGAVNITDFLNLSGSDNALPDLSVLEAELSSEKELGCNSPSVESKTSAGEDTRETGGENTIVQILADQKKEAAVRDKNKVSPLKLIKENDQYKLSKRKRKSDRPVAVDQVAKRKTKGRGSLLKCQHCDKEFPLGGAWQMKKHLLSKHKSQDQDLSCSICKKKFSIKSGLEAHLEMHKEIFPWKCGRRTCAGKFDKLTEFVVHLKSHHNISNVDKALKMLK